MRLVVDSNVAVVAESLAHQADVTCVETCQERLLELIACGGLVLDSGDEIIEEYTSVLGHSGQPGIGRAFVKWAHDRRFDPSCCVRVPITEMKAAGWRRYEEFSDRPVLRSFDRSDQKFVAVALASGLNPPVLVAIDRGWWLHYSALTAEGVGVGFLCPQHDPRTRAGVR